MGEFFGLSLLPYSLVAAVSCKPIDLLILRSKSEYNNARNWSITISPSEIKRLEQSIQKLEVQLLQLSSNVSKKDIAYTLSLVNSVVSAVFVVTGVFVSAPIVFTGSILFSGSMMVATAKLSPQSEDAIEIIRDTSINRLSGILGIAADDAYAVSLRSAKYSSIAGSMLNTVGLGLSFFDTYDKGKKFFSKKEDRDIFIKNLRMVKSDLKKLQDARQAEALRKACLKAVKEDLEFVKLNKCLNQPLG